MRAEKVKEKWDKAKEEVSETEISGGKLTEAKKAFGESDTSRGYDLLEEAENEAGGCTEQSCSPKARDIRRIRYDLAYADFVCGLGERDCDEVAQRGIEKLDEAIAKYESGDLPQQESSEQESVEED